jgi:DNA primase
MMSQAVVFIVKNSKGEVIGAQRRFVNSDFGSKTKTSHGFEKSKHIMVYNRNANIAICEGPFTALSAWHYGYCAVCTFGSGITAEQLDLINSLSDELESNVFVAEDNDAAGKKYSDSICSYFYWKNKPIGILKSNTGNDLNDCWKEKGKLIIEKAFMFNPAIPSVCTII